MTLEAAPGVHLRFAREAIGRVITKVDEPVEEIDEVSETEDSVRRSDRD